MSDGRATLAGAAKISRALVFATLLASGLIAAPFGPFAVIVFLFAFGFTFPVGVIVGLPLYWLARRTGLAGWHTAMLAGLLASQAMPLLLSLSAPGNMSLLLPPWLALAGIAGGLVFWTNVKPLPD